MAAYFILSDKHLFISLISKLILFNLLNRVNRSINVIKNMVFIEVLLASVTTILYIEGFCILKIESPLLLSLFCGILDILPYIETIIMFVPIIIFKTASKKYMIAIGLILLYLLIIISRQLLETKFISHKFRVHPLAIIIGLYIGLKIFGIIGLFIGAIYVLTVKEILA